MCIDVLRRAAVATAATSLLTAVVDIVQAKLNNPDAPQCVPTAAHKDIVASATGISTEVLPASSVTRLVWAVSAAKLDVCIQCL